MNTLLARHGCPDSTASVVAPLVIQLRSDNGQDVETNKSEQNLVTSIVIRLVIVAVNLRGDNVGQLDRHVVQRRANGSSSD